MAGGIQTSIKGTYNDDTFSYTIPLVDEQLGGEVTVKISDLQDKNNITLEEYTATFTLPDSREQITQIELLDQNNNLAETLANMTEVKLNAFAENTNALEIMFAIVHYEENGMILKDTSVIFVDVEEGSAQVENLSLPLKDVSAGDIVKVFIWDEIMRPIPNYMKLNTTIKYGL